MHPTVIDLYFHIV